MTTRRSYTRYVHRYGNQWAVGLWRPHHGNYYIPLTAHQAKLSGCFGQFGPLSSLPHFPTRRQALRFARYWFGPDSAGYHTASTTTTIEKEYQT